MSEYIYDTIKFSYATLSLNALNKELTDWIDESTRQWALDHKISICFDHNQKPILLTPIKHDKSWRFLLVKREKEPNEEQELLEFINKYKDEPNPEIS